MVVVVPAAIARPADDDAARNVGALLRRARQQHGLSLRDVERRTERTNAYLSQIERGVIRRPDPVVLLQLAELYNLDFALLARWSGLDGGDKSAGGARYESVSAIMRLVLDLDGTDRARLLEVAQGLHHARET